MMCWNLGDVTQKIPAKQHKTNAKTQRMQITLQTEIKDYMLDKKKATKQSNQWFWNTKTYSLMGAPSRSICQWSACNQNIMNHRHGGVQPKASCVNISSLEFGSGEVLRTFYIKSKIETSHLHLNKTTQITALHVQQRDRLSWNIRANYAGVLSPKLGFGLSAFGLQWNRKAE